MTTMQSTRQFEGRVALVTGAGTGMGAEIAVLLAERGADVARVGRREQLLRDVAALIEATGSKALVVPGDVSDPRSVRQAVDTAVSSLGDLHHAVNNAGISSSGTEITDVSDDEWQNTLQINLSGLFYGVRAQVAAMQAAGHGGSIVNVSSVFADRGLAQRAAYSAAKHGIRGLTRSAAVDWAARGIRINELQPGVIATPMLGDDPAGAERVAATIPARRLGSGREVATAVAFLLSDEASYITGAHLAVDGGFLA